MRRAVLSVALLTALFVALRAPGLDARLPHAPEPDGKLVHQAVDPPERGKYPFLWVAVLAASGAVEPSALAPDAPLPARLADARRPFRAGRLMVLLVSAAAVPATYLLGRRLLSPRAALLAAALTAVGPIWTLYGVQARPHALAASTGLWAVVACAAAVRRPSAARQVGAALAVGLAGATFHSGLLVVPTYLLGLAVARPRGRALVGAGLGLALATALGLWSYATPPDANLTPGLSRTIRLQGEEAVEPREDSAVRISGHAIWPGLFDGGGLPVLANLLRSCDPVLLGLAPVGLTAILVAAVRRRRAAARPGRGPEPSGDAAPAALGERLVIAGHPVVLLAVFGTYSGSAERFFVPLVPYLALLAARAVQRPLAARAPWPALVALGVLVLPAATSARLTQLRARPDSSERMARWIATHLDPGAGTILATSDEELPLLRRSVPRHRAGRRAIDWFNQQVQQPAPAPGVPTWSIEDVPLRTVRSMTRAERPEEAAQEMFDALGPRYVLLAPKGVRVERYVDPVVERTLEQVVRARGGRLLTRVDPVRPCASGRRGLDSYLGDSAVRDLWCLDFLGAPLELWELPDPAPEDGG